MYLLIFLLGLGIVWWTTHKISQFEQRIQKLESKNSLGVISSASVKDVISEPVQQDSDTLTEIQNAEVSKQSDAQYDVPAMQTFAPRREEEVVSTEEKTGQWLGKIGIVAILLGVSFFLRYAFVNNIIGPTGRIVLGIIFGLAMLSLAQFIKHTYKRYAEMLMGGSIGIFYLTIFSAYSFFHFIDTTTAFALMVLITAFGCILSIAESSKGLAMLAVFGGFVTPVLLSTSDNNFWILMPYILILDLGILAIAMFKRWHQLHYVGFILSLFTFIGWFESFYTAPQMWITIFFASLLFAVYYFVTVLRSIMQKENVVQYDILLIVCNAGAYFGLLTILLHTNNNTLLAYMAIVLAVLYIFTAYISSSNNSNDGILGRFLAIISVVFVAIAIPIQLSGPWLTIGWFVLSAVLFYFSFIQWSREMRVLSVIGFSFGLIHMFAFEGGFDYAIDQVVLNNRFLLSVLAIGIAVAMATAFRLYGGGDDNTERTHDVKEYFIALVIFANFMTVFTLSSEIGNYYGKQIFNLHKAYSEQMAVQGEYKSTANSGSPYIEQSTATKNKQNTLISIFWTLYALALIGVGFVKRSRLARSFGLVFFLITAIKIFLDVWSFGSLYRIISSMVFGILALLASFTYAKYKHLIKF
jgi:uncharacterized membrane protein